MFSNSLGPQSTTTGPSTSTSSSSTTATSTTGTTSTSTTGTTATSTASTSTTGTSTTATSTRLEKIFSCQALFFWSPFSCFLPSSFSVFFWKKGNEQKKNRNILFSFYLVFFTRLVQQVQAHLQQVVVLLQQVVVLLQELVLHQPLPHPQRVKIETNKREKSQKETKR